jgi:hypothetical protein
MVARGSVVVERQPRNNGSIFREVTSAQIHRVRADPEQLFDEPGWHIATLDGRPSKAGRYRVASAPG